MPGTVQVANYDTGGQGVAYNVTSANGSANSYRSDGVDLETTADTQDTSRGRRRLRHGLDERRTVVQVHRPGSHRRESTRSASGWPRPTGSPTRCTSPTPPAPTCPARSPSRTPAATRPGPRSPPASPCRPAQQTLTVDQDSNGFNFHYLAFTQGSGGGRRRRRRHRPDRVLRHAGPRAGPADHGLLDPGRHRLPGAPTPPTATPAPAGPACPATRSGWTSTSAPRSRSAA